MSCRETGCGFESHALRFTPAPPSWPVRAHGVGPPSRQVALIAASPSLPRDDRGGRQARPGGFRRLAHRGSARAGGPAQLPRSSARRHDAAVDHRRRLRHREPGAVGAHAGLVQVDLRRRQPLRRPRRRPVQQAADRVPQPDRLVGRHLGHRPRHQLRPPPRHPRGDGPLRSLLYPDGPRAHRRPPHHGHPLAGRRLPSDRHLPWCHARQPRRLRGRQPHARLALGIHHDRPPRHPLCGAALFPARRTPRRAVGGI